MDELVEENLRAMGYKGKIPPKLVAMLTEFKKRQDQVRPAPLSLEAIIFCSMMHEAIEGLTAKFSKPPKEKKDGEKKDGEKKDGGEGAEKKKGAE